MQEVDLVRLPRKGWSAFTESVQVRSELHLLLEGGSGLLAGLLVNIAGLLAGFKASLERFDLNFLFQP